MNPLIAALLGLVEGLTEYLPVSSTGHLILAAHFLGSDSDASKSFDIVIQLGAILAVVLHYRSLLWERLLGLAQGDRRAVKLAVALLVAFVPTAVMGLLLRKVIKEVLFGVWLVIGALIAGGVLMIAIEWWRRKTKATGLSGLEHIDARRALAIGLGQCFALWPGASRSMCTIVAGQLAGISTSTAAEFSFLLALPTLGAATTFELLKARHELMASVGTESLLIGLAVSFVVAWAVIAGFLRYLKHSGLSPFGWYRIALGVFLLWVLAK